MNWLSNKINEYWENFTQFITGLLILAAVCVLFFFALFGEYVMDYMVRRFAYEHGIEAAEGSDRPASDDSRRTKD